MRTKLILIHGTFARNARWAKKDSPLPKYFLRHLDPHLEMTTVPWSGANTTAAREAGIQNLIAEIDATLRDGPARCIIIGHSHGGTIAVQAVKRNPSWTNVIVVCLSTPFVSVRPRRTNTVARVSMFTGVYLAANIVVVTLYLLFNGFRPIENLPLPWMVMSVLSVTATLIYPVGKYIRRKAELIRNDNQPSFTELKAPLLLIRDVGDEVSALLGSIQFVEWLFDSILSLLDTSVNRIVAGLHKRTRLTLFIVGLVRIVVVVAVASMSPPTVPGGTVIKWLSTIGMALLLFSSRTATLGFVRFLGKFMVGIQIGFGMLLFAICVWLPGSLLLPLHEQFFYLFWLEFAVDSSPPGSWPVTVFQRQRVGARLAHSAPYGDARVYKFIINWVKKDVGWQDLHSKD